MCVFVCFCVDSNNTQQIEYFIFIQHSSILCDRAIAFLLHRQMQTNEIALALALMLVCWLLVQVPVAGRMTVLLGAGGGDVRDGNDDDNGIKYIANV